MKKCRHKEHSNSVVVAAQHWEPMGPDCRPGAGRFFGWIKLTKSFESRYDPKMILVCEEMSSQRALNICGGGSATLGTDGT